MALFKSSRPASIAASADRVLPCKPLSFGKLQEMVFAPLPSLFSCAAQMQNSFPYFETAAMVFLLNVFTVFIFFIFGLVRWLRAFDGDDNTKPLGLCNRKIKIFLVIEKILLNFY